jgi:hypothetical protein
MILYSKFMEDFKNLKLEKFHQKLLKMLQKNTIIFYQIVH